MKVVVIGAGAWGTAIANLLANNSLDVFFFIRDQDLIHSINTYSQNNKYSIGFTLNNSIYATNDARVISDACLIFVIVPTQFVRIIFEKIKDYISNAAKIIICSKGIEENSLFLISESLDQIIPQVDKYFLSGPNFAKEVMQGLPCRANIAGNDLVDTKSLSDIISNKNFKVLPIADLTGAQVVSALKNVIAIFCGILEGKNFGLNARAMTVTASLIEIKQFCKIKGSDASCLMDFCGIGDIMLTCYARNSRNMRFGIDIAHKKDFSNELVEGLYTLKAAYKLANAHEMKAPIVRALYDIIYMKKDIDLALSDFFHDL